MKKLFIAFCLLFLAAGLHAQTPFWLQINNYQRIRGVWADSTLKFPIDTVHNKAANSSAVINGIMYVCNGTKWSAVGSGVGTSGVTSFNSRTGVVVPNVGDYNLDMLGDVSTTVTSSASNGDVLSYNNTSHQWENAHASSGTILDSVVISCDGLHPDISFPLSHTGYKSVHFDFEDERALTPSQADDGTNGYLSWQVAKKGDFKVYELYNY